MKGQLMRGAIQRQVRARPHKPGSWALLSGQHSCNRDGHQWHPSGSSSGPDEYCIQCNKKRSVSA